MLYFIYKIKILINAIDKIFPNIKRINCFFHFKQDLIRNIKSYGLYNKANKETSDKIIKILSLLPIVYNGNINIIDNQLNDIKCKYPKYSNFINNYFIPNKLEYFKNNSLNYNSIPKECRTNNYLENYNGYIKKRLGTKRIINWMNFISFIKSESVNSLKKLFNNNEEIFKNKNTYII